jgi:sugar phosphate permease
MNSSSNSLSNTSSKGIFFGWWLLLGLLAAYTTTNGVIINTLPLFYPSISMEFGFTPSQVTFPAQLLFTLVAFLSLGMGFMLERNSPKILMITGSCVLIGAFVFYFTISASWQYTSVYILLALGLTAAGIVPSMFLITRWFGKYRGLAVGILLMGSSLGTTIFSQFTGRIIQGYGWRTAALALAGAMAVGVLLPFLFLVKNRPEDVGTTRDGIPKEEQPSEFQSDFVGVTLAMAAKTPVFYMLCAVTAVMWFCIVGVVNNQTIYFKDLGIGIDIAKNVLTAFGFAAMIGKITFGYLGDTFNKKYIMLLAAFNLLLGSVMLRVMGSNPDALLFPYAVIYGLGFSGAFTMIQVMVADFYAGVSYGKILGVFTMVDTLAGAAGIAVLSGIRTKGGSYLPAFELMIGLCTAALLVVVFLKKPESMNTLQTS